MKDWVETTFDGDPMAAIKMILSSKSSGQIVLNVSQGTVCGDVVWRERVRTVTATHAPSTNCLDNQPPP